MGLFAISKKTMIYMVAMIFLNSNQSNNHENHGKKTRISRL